MNGFCKNIPKKNEKDFTLIELLVVIAIIAILAALMFPALNRAKKLAKKVSCLNNLRQVMIITSTYAEDQKGMIPNYYAYDYSYLYVLGGMTLYSKMPAWKKAFSCPSVPYHQYTSTLPYRGEMGNIYGMLIEGSGSRMKFDTGQKLNGGYGHVAVYYSLSSSQRPIYADSVHTKGILDYGVFVQSCQIYTCSASTTSSITNIHTRHSNQANFGYWDGHAGSMSGLQFYQAGIGRYYRDENGAFHSYPAF